MLLLPVPAVAPEHYIKHQQQETGDWPPSLHSRGVRSDLCECVQLRCQLKCLLTNKARLISIHSCEDECLEAGSSKHVTTPPVRCVSPPTDEKSEMIWVLAYIPVKMKGQVLAAATHK